jgi:phage shock protein C
VDNKLYRSRNQKMLAGVCGGIAEYFNIDATLIRLIWAVVSIPSFGTGILIYIIAAIIIPERPYGQQYNADFIDVTQSMDKTKVMVIVGTVLILIGIIALISGLFPFLWRILKNAFWPLLIIIIGIVIIYSSWKNREGN